MICRECDREMRQINYLHLKSCCGLTPQQYRQKYPGSKSVDPDVKKSCGLPLAKNPHWKGGISRPVCSVCGCNLSRHSSLTHCRRCSQKINGNPFLGQQHSDQARTKMREAAQSRDPTTYKSGVADPAQRSRQRIAWWGKLSKEQRAERLLSFIAAGQVHNKKNKETRIENKVADLLILLNKPFERNVQVGRLNADFLVEGHFIVECYGDYWHCNPRLFQAADYQASLHLTAAEKWRKDQDRVDAFTKQGYLVLCLWEHDIHNCIDEVTERLRNVLARRGA